MPTVKIAQLLAVFLLLAACGKSSKNHRGGKGDEDAEAGGPADVTSPSPDGGDGGGETPAKPEEPPKPEFDESAMRATALHYYQWDVRLKDLFSPVNFTSQLCWPAALASEFEYLRTRETEALDELPEVADGANKVVDEIRHFTALCKTDRTAGTTVIQGVRCIDEHLKAAQLTADVEVAGVDAQWGSLGFFPTGTTATDGPISPARLREAAAADASILLLVGYYSKQADGSLKRERGHFVSVSGFAYQRAWGEDRLLLRIMNPGQAPAGASPAETFESVELRRLEDGAWPEDVAFELLGAGFGEGSQKALVESAIEFTVRR